MVHMCFMISRSRQIPPTIAFSQWQGFGTIMRGLDNVSSTRMNITVPESRPTRDPLRRPLAPSRSCAAAGSSAGPEFLQTKKTIWARRLPGPISTRQGLAPRYPRSQPRSSRFTVVVCGQSPSHSRSPQSGGRCSAPDPDLPVQN